MTKEQLYETCLTFLASAVERGDDERARFWSRTAFKYAPIERVNKGRQPLCNYV